MLRRPQWPIRRPLTIQSGPLWCPGGPGVISLTRTKQWNSISKCHPLGNCGNGQSVIVIPLNRCQCLSSSENHWYPKESLSIQVIQLPRCRWMFLEWENPSRKSFNLERISSRRIFGFFFFLLFLGEEPTILQPMHEIPFYFWIFWKILSTFVATCLFVCCKWGTGRLAFYNRARIVAMSKHGALEANLLEIESRLIASK